MMRMWRWIGRMAVIGIALLSLIPLPHLLAQPRSGGELVLVSTEEPDTLDAQKTSAALTGLLMRYLGDTLVTKDLRGNYTAGLARSWTVSRDGLTWRFELRQGVKFHDGTPFNAQAVKASVDRALAPETKSPIAGALFGPVASVQATGESTVVIRLKEAFAPFLDNLTDPRAMIVSPQAAQQLGDRFGRSPVGTGPFKFQEWRSADRIIFARNPEYQWGPAHVHAGPPYVERLVLRIMPESAAQVAAFERGELSILPAPPTDVRRLQASGKYAFFTFLRKGVGLFIEFNVTKEPFNDLRVRRAMNFAVEKKSILQIALEGLGEVAHGPLPPSICPMIFLPSGRCATACAPNAGRPIVSPPGWPARSSSGDAAAFSSGRSKCNPRNAPGCGDSLWKKNDGCHWFASAKSSRPSPSTSASAMPLLTIGSLKPTWGAMS